MEQNNQRIPVTIGRENLSNHKLGTDIKLQQDYPHSVADTWDMATVELFSNDQVSVVYREPLYVRLAFKQTQFVFISWHIFQTILRTDTGWLVILATPLFLYVPE